ncbi:MAG: YitT family protein [Bacteroidales bacterium]|nr:YitT family protein [Bacteroidales bacterium]
MAFIHNEKVFSWKWIINYSLIVIGSLVLAAGFVFFITPYNIVPGGVFGVGIIVHHLTKGIFSFAPEGIPVGLMGLLLNIPLTIIGIRVLGPRFGVKTVVGFVLASLFIDLLTIYWGDAPLVEDDALLSSIFGGVLIGLGLGLIFKTKATSGGTDIVAMILAKYSGISLGQLLIYVDSAIVLGGLLVFRDWKIPLYSWIVIFITGKVIDIVLEGVSYDKALLIVSDKHEEIKEKILKDLNRGGTIIPGKGMYKEMDKSIIFTVVSRRELTVLQYYIHEVDANAFLTVMDAHEILGEGFKSLQDKVAQSA